MHTNNIKKILFLNLIWAAVFLLRIEYLQAQISTPFNGFNIGIPTTIECEQFDYGSNNVAYCNTVTFGTIGKYRDECNEVAIFRNDEYGGSRGYCVGGLNMYGWLQYSFINSEAGWYKFKIRTRSGPNDLDQTRFRLRVDDYYFGDLITIYNQAWFDAVGTIYIPSGSHKLKLFVEEYYGTSCSALFDYITLYKDTPNVINSGAILPVVLSTNSDLQSAKNNASNLQTTINNAQTGDTVQIPSGRYFICQPTPIENAPDSFGVMKIPLVKSVQGVTTVNTYSGWVGVQFTVGASSLTVTSLGRWVVNGNSGNHTVKIMDAANNELASVTVNTANGLPDTFAYTALANNLRRR